MRLSVGSCFIAVVVLGANNGCAGREAGQVLWSANAAGTVPRAPRAEATPYLVQELFASRDCAKCNPIVALAPPHAKATFVDPSFFKEKYQSVGATFAISNPAGDLFVAVGARCKSSNAPCVAEFAPPYTHAPIAVISNGLGSVGGTLTYGNKFALDSQENLYVVSAKNYSPATDDVVEYSPPYNGSPTAVLIPRDALLTRMGGIAVHKGKLFVGLDPDKGPCGLCASYVDEYDPPPAWGKQVAEATIGGVDGCPKEHKRYQCLPYDEAFDREGNLFVSWSSCGKGTCGNVVAEWAPPYKAKPDLLITKDIESPQSIALDSKGDLFVLNSDVPSYNYVTEYAPPYTKPPKIINDGIGPVDRLGNLVVDSAGNLFVADYGEDSGGEILEYQPPYTASPISITIGLDNFAPVYLALGPKVKR